MTEPNRASALLDNVIVVLHRPQDARNIGAILRGMKNMAMRDLRLVQPEPFDQEVILRVAHGCEDLLEGMKVYTTLDAALEDALYVVGTAALSHRGRRQTDAVRTVATTWVARLHQGKLALLFGQEDNGLDHTALDRCHLLVTLPTNPAYPALNLAQSVLLLLYEVRMAVIADRSTPLPPTDVAPQATLERIFQETATVLETIGFFKGNNQAAVMRKVRQIVYKATLSPEEAALLLAILRGIERDA